MALSEQTQAETLQELLKDYGIDCTEEQSLLLAHHLALVIEKNKVLNLTRIVDVDEALVLHVLDSLLLLACSDVTMDPSTRFVDMGTGAGFPGIPLGVLTGAQGVLVDSVGKKVTAVNEFIKELGLKNLVAEHSRVEDLALRMRGTQDYVVARALARTNILIEYAAPFLKMGGSLLVAKARPDEDELKEAQQAAKICGLSHASHETFELPHSLGHREILIYKRVGKPTIRLPRKPGTAKREPLGI